jgi:adenylate kinase
MESGPCLILLGGPGSGKGTHGKAIAEALDWTHFSTGAYFRHEIEQQTPLGKLALAHISRGELVPDDSTLGLVKEMLGTLPGGRGFLLDGYPRSASQARDLQQLLQQRGHTLATAVFLNVSDGEILRRLSGRLTCRACQKTYHRDSLPPENPGKCSCGGDLYQRDDDNPRNIRKRLLQFHKLNRPLLDFYKKFGKLREIQAEGSREKVSARAIAAARSSLTP